MMIRLLHICSIFGLAFSVGCASARKSHQLAEFKKTDWTTVNRTNVEQVIGKPDTSGNVYKTNTEALVYLDKMLKQPQMSLLFDIASGKLISATWFAISSGSQMTTQQVQAEYPQVTFTDSPKTERGAWGKKIKIYQSPEGSLKVAMEEDSQRLNSISWQSDIGKSEPDKRKPTSH